MAKGKSNGRAKAISTKSSDAATLVLPPSLYLGPRSAAASATFLNSHSISHVLSIGSTPSSLVPDVKYHRLSLTDSPGSSISNVADEAIRFIDDAITAKNGSGKILVHCSAGVSRSPTIVVAYLMTRQGMSLKEALGRVVLARPTVSPNPGFLRQLKDLEMSLFGSVSLEVEELPRRKEDRERLFEEVKGKPLNLPMQPQGLSTGGSSSEQPSPALLHQPLIKLFSG
ncbi:hypothetical protein JAAARDRAFT_195032 [Jaapia argillacea MUCL 33604]|uniref:protein-tyrosine-phosphatase n=1 Tax=Jaapia argillacea MUCL 33604 TaxID=933084 RepID=A0A067PNK5_9AGAM|nr:hypothetical protein JAAARDRAFT_195032 [Jaapia argillacea MUCL 33604]